MRTYTILFLLSTLTFANGAFAKFEAHEWGTFTSLVGSNGITQNGMYHEDERLPAFVHGFGETRPASSSIDMNLLRPLAFGPIPDPEATPVPRPPCRNKGCFGDEVLKTNVITQKMETPVIYFYADHAQHIDVNVKFPEGVFTETYPAPVSSSPQRNDKNFAITNGQAHFAVDVLAQKTASVPYVESENIYSHARNVNSNVVRNGNEQEKFIFYRGLGRFQPRFSITSQNGAVALQVPANAMPQAAFLVHVDQQGQSQLLEVSGLVAGQRKVIPATTIQVLENHNSKSQAVLTGARAKNTLVAALVRSGLYQDEAQAMINTWENGYLKVPGLRLLYILPRAEVDQVLPLNFSPAPENFTRVFVGRIEILIDTEEKQILTSILQQRENFDVASLGRFAEPMLRRVLQVYQANPRLATQAADETLLNTLIDRSLTSDTSHKTSVE